MLYVKTKILILLCLMVQFQYRFRTISEDVNVAKFPNISTVKKKKPPSHHGNQTSMFHSLTTPKAFCIPLLLKSPMQIKLTLPHLKTGKKKKKKATQIIKLEIKGWCAKTTSYPKTEQQTTD